eukprot:CAMPEP_0176349936 /NCGR_PEP_ID=MMETSP0126-20121128/9071_1 /TAXON_ID=141414 ORGANISM="Strombidinopsis acuminatum, Strain SPMC142" /NCGR_SAMPLE_ID=MMETSP0126 /ASSEMBLY_ACC=CAM_ASM_000229 /LENGTH=43 /DNA_ID= /DNA_START= /DNA_END= /DNA_ORIENTATION=
MGKKTALNAADLKNRSPPNERYIWPNTMPLQIPQHMYTKAIIG